jgi:hypothetical protein
MLPTAPDRRGSVPIHRTRQDLPEQPKQQQQSAIADVMNDEDER